MLTISVGLSQRDQRRTAAVRWSGPGRGRCPRVQHFDAAAFLALSEHARFPWDIPKSHRKKLTGKKDGMHFTDIGSRALARYVAHVMRLR